jgi:D-xylose transport system ATP-binding protein
MPVQPLLEVRAIHKRFGAVEVLRDVHIHVSAGEVLALVGDNGAGKSTLARAISGAGPADRGTILIDGEQVRIDSPQAATRAGIATIYQDLALCDNLSVVDNLFLGKELLTPAGRLLRWIAQRRMEQQATSLLQDLSVVLNDVRRPVASLSGGQRQSVAIARALLGHPRLVLLDEPTAALGVSQTAQVLALIKKLRTQGHAVILISHNMEDVLSVADRVSVLRLGRNNGDFDIASTNHQQIVAAITGATRVPYGELREAGGAT